MGHRETEESKATEETRAPKDPEVQCIHMCDQLEGHRANTYLTSLPLVSVHHHGTYVHVYSASSVNAQ